MDARENPYAPGAGTKPPGLTGRDTEIDAVETLLERLRRGAAEQSMIVRGLRAVGKTVLLNTFEDLAVERDWLTVFKECESTSLPALVARHCRRLIDDLRPGAKAKRLLTSAMGPSTTCRRARPAASSFASTCGVAKRTVIRSVMTSPTSWWRSGRLRATVTECCFSSTRCSSCIHRSSVHS